MSNGLDLHIGSLKEFQSLPQKKQMEAMYLGITQLQRGQDQIIGLIHGHDALFASRNHDMKYHLWVIYTCLGVLAAIMGLKVGNILPW